MFTMMMISKDALNRGAKNARTLSIDCGRVSAQFLTGIKNETSQRSRDATSGRAGGGGNGFI
jgi:hypothetical protein